VAPVNSQKESDGLLDPTNIIFDLESGSVKNVLVLFDDVVVIKQVHLASFATAIPGMGSRYFKPK